MELILGRLVQLQAYISCQFFFPCLFHSYSFLWEATFGCLYKVLLVSEASLACHLGKCPLALSPVACIGVTSPQGFRFLGFIGGCFILGLSLEFWFSETMPFSRSLNKTGKQFWILKLGPLQVVQQDDSYSVGCSIGTEDQVRSPPQETQPEPISHLAKGWPLGRPTLGHAKEIGE